MAKKKVVRKTVRITPPVFRPRPKPIKNLSDSAKLKKLDRIKKLRSEIAQDGRKFEEIDKLKGQLGLLI